MSGSHNFRANVEWTGNKGEGTSSYTTYDRDYLVQIDGKASVKGSSDPAFRGDAARHNPEDMLLASVSACHMLWYLHLCADAGVTVTAYSDNATGTMTRGVEGKIRFTGITLHPRIAITKDSDRDAAHKLHHKAHDACFIANSVNFPIDCEPDIAFEVSQ